jgi:iron(III) transport system substrate-binding protein
MTRRELLIAASRRGLGLSLAATLPAPLLVSLWACARQPATPPVTLYSSVDHAVLAPIVESISLRSGIPIALVTDTEATRTTGLVQRLIAERAEPQADLWWSGEVLGTIQLARAGVLASASSAQPLSTYPFFPPGWRDQDSRWFPVALRPRVLVYSTAGDRPASVRPRSLEDLAGPTSGSVAIANPAFGTTRGHIAAIWATHGRDQTLAWLSRVRWRMVDGNSAVVRAVAQGQCPVGLTDFDDVVAGQAQGWRVDCILPPLALGPAGGPATTVPPGALFTPGTAALVADGPLARLAESLATRGQPEPPIAAPGLTLKDLAPRVLDLILSDATELALAASAWKSKAAAGLVVQTSGEAWRGLVDPRVARATPALVNWDRALDVADEAVAAAQAVISGQG